MKKKLKLTRKPLRQQKNQKAPAYLSISLSSVLFVAVIILFINKLRIFR